MYPILMRLTDRGLLETTWEADVPAGRPPRHLYRLTRSGRALATELALRRHAIDGRSLDGEVVAPVGANLPDALIFCLGIFPVLGLALGVIGAGFGARTLPQPRT